MKSLSSISGLLCYFTIVGALPTPLAYGTEVDFSFHVSQYAGSEGMYIYITSNQKIAQETWYIVNECPRKPDLSVYISHTPVAMEQYIFISATSSEADKRVCITNRQGLDEKTLRLLKLTR